MAAPGFVHNQAAGSQTLSILAAIFNYIMATTQAICKYIKRITYNHENVFIMVIWTQGNPWPQHKIFFKQALRKPVYFQAAKEFNIEI